MYTTEKTVSTKKIFIEENERPISMSVETIYLLKKGVKIKSISYVVGGTEVEQEHFKKIMTYAV